MKLCSYSQVFWHLNFWHLKITYKKTEGDVYLLLILVIPEVMLHKLKNNLYNDYFQKKISPSLNRLRCVKLAFERNQWMLTQYRPYIKTWKTKVNGKKEKRNPQQNPPKTSTFFPILFFSKLKLDHKTILHYFNPVRFLILAQVMGH